MLLSFIIPILLMLVLHTSPLGQAEEGELIMARLMIPNCSMGFFTLPSGPVGADRESFLFFLAGLPASALD
jgi:hypothetical protein